jgi:putative MATE family efflux protein
MSSATESAARVSQRTTDLGTMPLGRLLLSLSLPAIVGMVVMSCYNLIDTFWVGRLPDGTGAIAALTVLFPLQMVAGSLGMGTGVGVSSLAARRFGAGRLDEVGKVAGHAVLVPIVCGLIIEVLCLLIPGPLVRFFGAPADVAPLAVQYLTTVAFGFPFLLSMMTLSGLFRGAGNTVLPMTMMITSAVMNAVLAPMLIFGWAGAPAMGIRGAGLATAIAQLSGATLAAIYLWSGKSGYHVARRHLRLRLPILAEIGRVGLPAAAMGCVGSVVGITFNTVLGSFGTQAVAAQGLAQRIVMLIISFIGGGVYQGLLPVVAYSFGAHNYRRMWRAYRAAALGTSGIAIFLAAVTIALTPQIVGLFTKDPQLLRLAVLAYRLRIATLFLVEPQMMGVASLQGMGKGLHAMAVTMVQQALLVIPALLLLAHYGGVMWAYAAQPISDILAVAVTASILVSVYRRYPPNRTYTNPVV